MKPGTAALRGRFLIVVAAVLLGWPSAPANALTPEQLFEKIIPRVQPKKTKRPAATAQKPRANSQKQDGEPADAPSSAGIPKPKPRPGAAQPVDATIEASDAQPKPKAKPAADAATIALAKPDLPVDADKAARALAATKLQTGTDGAGTDRASDVEAGRIGVGTLAPHMTMDELAFAPPVAGSKLAPEPAGALDMIATPLGVVLPPEGVLPPEAGLPVGPPGALEAEAEDAEKHADGPPLPREKPGVILAAIVPPRAPVLPETLSLCRSQMTALKISAKAMPPVSDGACGAADPFGVSALQDGKVALEPAATTNCETASMLSTWIAEDVQASAVAAYGAQVTALRIADSYSCRGRNNILGAQLSEHAFMNAIDIGAFQIDGRWVTVEKGSGHTDKDTDFIQKVRQQACLRFMTVLGPGSDGYHENHLHLDMRHRGRNGNSRYCH